MNMPPDPSPPVSGHDAAPRVPPWATDELPDVGMFVESDNSNPKESLDG